MLQLSTSHISLGHGVIIDTPRFSGRGQKNFDAQWVTYLVGFSIWCRLVGQGGWGSEKLTSVHLPTWFTTRQERSVSVISAGQLVSPNSRLSVCAAPSRKINCRRFIDGDTKPLVTAGNNKSIRRCYYHRRQSVLLCTSSNHPSGRQDCP